MNNSIRTLAVALVIGALFVPSAAFAQDAADQAWRAGLQAFQSGNPGGCVTQMRTALSEGGEAYDRWGWLHMMLGICLGQRNQRDEAITELQTAKELVTEDLERFQVNHALAQVYVGRGNTGDYDRAIAAENEASQYASGAEQQALVAKTLGQAHYFKEDWGSAIRQLSQAAAARGADVDVAQKLGRAYLESGDSGNAQEWFERTLNLDSDNVTALTNLGRIQLNAGSWTGAINYLERAIREDPQNMQIRNMLGRAYLGDRRFDDAIAQLSQVTQSRPSDGPSQYNLGQAYQAAGDDGRAIEAYTRALANLPAGDLRADCLYDIGFVYEKVGRYEDALAALEDSAAIDADSKTTEAIERVKERIRRQKGGGF